MAMTIGQLKKVRKEMDRLDEKIVALLSAQEVAEEWEKKHQRWEPKPINGSAESGAVRRASMDLTRELAELRRS